ncbi:MAG: hypothetical protein HOO06_10955 [Bdellovibrionaceae bacterium]|nr:hypothetical protein [Pseudobdellovibrionaceae bacterium]
MQISFIKKLLPFLLVMTVEHAQAAKQCFQLFSKINTNEKILPKLSAHFRVSKYMLEYLDDLASRPILDSNSINQIRSLFSDLPAKQAMNKAFQLYLQKRLARISTLVRRDIEHWFDYPGIAVKEDWKLLERGNLVSGQTKYKYLHAVNIEHAPGLKDSLHIYSTQVHEVEHVIAHKLVELEGASDAKIESQKTGIAYEKDEGPTSFGLLREASGMLMEAEFILAIPQSFRQIYVSTMTRKLRDSFSNHFIPMMNIMLTAKSPVDYVEKMWAIDRYNPKSAKDADGYPL